MSIEKCNFMQSCNLIQPWLLHIKKDVLAAKCHRQWLLTIIWRNIWWEQNRKGTVQRILNQTQNGKKTRHPWLKNFSVENRWWRRENVHFVSANESSNLSEITFRWVQHYANGGNESQAVKVQCRYISGASFGWHQTQKSH